MFSTFSFYYKKKILKKKRGYIGPYIRFIITLGNFNDMVSIVRLICIAFRFKTDI
jgi:hypothetical protein